MSDKNKEAQDAAQKDEQLYLLKLISGETLIVIGAFVEQGNIPAFVCTREPQSIKQIPKSPTQTDMLPFKYIPGSRGYLPVFYASHFMHAPLPDKYINETLKKRYLESISGIKCA